MFIGNKKAFFSQHMNDGKSGGLSKKQYFVHHICTTIMVMGYDKVLTWPPILLSLVSRYVYRIQKTFFVPTFERRQSGRPYRKKQSMKHHIWSKIRVVSYPKMINSEVAACFAVAGVQILDMFIGYR